jgi:hypothetical protein
LDPGVYRAEVMIQARSFGSALEAFLEANEKLAGDNALLDDPDWQNEMRAIVEQVKASGLGLAGVGPPPGEYQAIDDWLERVGPEAEGLRDNYLQALDTRDPQFFAAASDNFARIKEYLYQALEEMARAGWPME